MEPDTSGGIVNAPSNAVALALLSSVVFGAGGLAFGFILTQFAIIPVAFLSGGIPSDAVLIVLSLVLVQGVGCIGVALAYPNLRQRFGGWFASLFGVDDSSVPEPSRPPETEAGEPSLSERLSPVFIETGSDFGAGKRQLGIEGVFTIPVSVPDLRDLAAVVGGYVLAFGGVLVVASIVTFLVDPDTGANQAAEVGMQNPEVLLLLIPASILLVGPGEELLFRGVVQGRLREVFHPYAAIVIAAAFFAGLHFFALTGGSVSGNLVALGILTVPSIVFGAIYEYTENILVPSLVHGLYNATLFSMLYVAVTFGDPEELEQAQSMLVALF